MRLLPFCFFTVALTLSPTPTARSAAGDGAGAPTPSPVATGTIEGVVRYISDAARPWKYARYYVKTASTGGLAEAVVAVEREGGANASSALLPGSVPPAPGVRTQTVDQIQFQFVPETVAIRVGDAVRFTNSDDALHNVMTGDGAEPFNTTLAKEGEWVRHFQQPTGLRKPLRIGCVFHGAMRAWIHVFDHPWFQVTGDTGKFRLEHLPGGRHIVGISHAAGRLHRSQTVEIRPGETTHLEIKLSPDDVRTSP